MTNVKDLVVLCIPTTCMLLTTTVEFNLKIAKRLYKTIKLRSLKNHIYRKLNNNNSFSYNKKTNKKCFDKFLYMAVSFDSENIR